MPDYSKRISGTSTYFSNQISITSLTGAGKSALIKGLKSRFEAFPYRWVSGGGIMRGFALEKGMTIEQFAAHCRSCPEMGYDMKCDETISVFAQHNWVICEGRLPHAFMPLAFKVLLTCELDVRAERRVGDMNNTTLESVKRSILGRDTDDGERYKIMYPGSMWPDKDFDLVVDNTRSTKEQTVERVVDGHRQWLLAISKSARVTHSPSWP